MAGLSLIEQQDREIDRLREAVRAALDYIERLPQFPDRGVDIAALASKLRRSVGEEA